LNVVEHLLILTICNYTLLIGYPYK